MKHWEIMPSFYYSAYNSYCEPSSLFNNKQTVFSQEGTTQSDPLAMSLFGIAIIPLIELPDDCFTVPRWCANNGNAVDSLDNMKTIFDSMKRHGPAFGYHLNDN